jgi:alkanesulfonate monooxygenase SsuD/methylene tetrahydromethanopterin reductase-like flavin-dependent oxidoreductase (luciferase family)
MDLRLGLFLPTVEALRGPRWLPDWAELRQMARLAEQVGFDSLFVPDHLLFRASAYWGFQDGDSRGTWEAWTLLGALAEATSRVALGTYVSAAIFRQPALLAKMAVTLDEVSGGRLILGLGSGSHRPELTAFGFPSDHLASRFDEALQVLVPLLRAGHVDFSGRYYQARDCELLPHGPRPGGPPIWIAAFGPRMMRLAAQWADAFTTAWHADPTALMEPFAALETACHDVGRRPGSIERSVGTFVTLADGGLSDDRASLRGTPEQIAHGLAALGAVGSTQVVCMLTPADRRGIERFAPVIEAVRQIAPPR